VNRCPQDIGQGKGQHTTYGQFSLATGLSSLLAYTATRVPDLLLYWKLLRFMALRVQLVILASAFVADSTLWWVSCLPHVALRAQPFVKVGARAPCAVVPGPLSGAQPLGDGVGSGDLENEVPQFSRGAKPWHRVWCPPFSTICKSRGTCHCAHGVGATVSEWHTNGESSSVIDVFIYLQLDLLF